jgi:hypothetical protein
MSGRLRAPVAVASAAVAAVTFAGAYALAHGKPATDPADPPPPAAVKLANDPLGKLGDARSLPDLAAPAAAPAPAVTPEAEAPAVEPDSEATESEEPATSTPTADPLPAPTSDPAPTQPPATPPPANFDDSG